MPARRSKSRPIHDWSEVADDGWRTLLVGNGMSINVDKRFAYKSLFDKAVKKHLINDVDGEIFAAFDTRNFEVVLAKLRDAIRLAEAMGDSTEELQSRFSSVQAALGKTLGAVHPRPREVPRQVRAALQDAFLGYGTVFTTNYDLLAYWAIGHAEGFNYFEDCFRPRKGGHCVFDPNYPAKKGSVPIYYLHGALHLVGGGSGVTRKLTTKDPGGLEVQLLDRFNSLDEGDPEARPLLVSEGSADDKLLKIEANDYLAYVHERLRQCDEPLVVFGQSLHEGDSHLIDAIASHPSRRVAVSLHDDGAGSAQRERRRIIEALEPIADFVTFFDAATHPLGRAREADRLDPARPRRRSRWVRRRVRRG